MRQTNGDASTTPSTTSSRSRKWWLLTFLILALFLVLLYDTSLFSNNTSPPANDGHQTAAHGHASTKKDSNNMRDMIDTGRRESQLVDSIDVWFPTDGIIQKEDDASQRQKEAGAASVRLPTQRLDEGAGAPCEAEADAKTKENPFLDPNGELLLRSASQQQRVLHRVIYMRKVALSDLAARKDPTVVGVGAGFTGDAASVDDGILDDGIASAIPTSRSAVMNSSASSANAVVDRFVVIRGQYPTDLIPVASASGEIAVDQPDEGEASDADAATATRAPRRLGGSEKRKLQRQQHRYGITTRDLLELDALRFQSIYKQRTKTVVGRRTSTNNKTRSVKVDWMFDGDEAEHEYDTGGGGETADAVGFVVELRTCVSNFWHGMSEFSLPLFALLNRYAAVGGYMQLPRVSTNPDTGVTATDPDAPPRRARVYVFVRAPERGAWGNNNKGCPSLNSFPYGYMNRPSWFLRLIAPNVIFFDERGPHRKYLDSTAVQPLNISLVLQHLVLDTLESFDACGATLYFPYNATTYPYFDSFVGVCTACERLLHAARSFVLKAMALKSLAARQQGDGGDENDDEGWRIVEDLAVSIRRQHNVKLNAKKKKKTGLSPHKNYIDQIEIREEDVGVVTAKELECPKVLVVDRQGHRNGRDVSDWDDVVAGIKQDAFAATSSSCAVVKVQKIDELPVTEQVKLLRWCTILVAVRGAAVMNAIFLRKNAGMLVLSPAHLSLPVSTAADNYAWYPFNYPMSSIHVVLATCKAHTPANIASVYHGMCVRRSVNFCDMKCTRSKVVSLLRDKLHAGMKAFGAGLGGVPRMFEFPAVTRVVQPGETEETAQFYFLP